VDTRQREKQAQESKKVPQRERGLTTKRVCTKECEKCLRLPRVSQFILGTTKFLTSSNGGRGYASCTVRACGKQFVKSLEFYFGALIKVLSLQQMNVKIAP
jgi:hypothetical protein